MRKVEETSEYQAVNRGSDLQAIENDAEVYLDVLTVNMHSGRALDHLNLSFATTLGRHATFETSRT